MRTIENVSVNYLQKATRLSLYSAADTVKEIYVGQHFHLNEDQEWEYADGTKKSYPTLNQRYGGMDYGLQGELTGGRDDVSSNYNKISVLVGNFEISTRVYDTEEMYEFGMPLAVKDGGIIVPYDEGTHKPEFIIGYVTGAPQDDEDVLTYQG